MFELEWPLMLLVVLGAIGIGFSKTGLPSMGLIVVALMATIFPARESIGILLPMLIIADIVAVIYYRHSVNWKTLFSLVPWVMGGLTIGYSLLFVMDSSRYLEIILGVIILALIVLQFVRERWGGALMNDLPQSRSFIGVMGTLAGFTTMIGNAGGSIMSIFLLAKGLTKKDFIGTGAWFFITVNLIKVPLFVNLGLITTETLTFNVWLIPAILAGTFLGIKFLPYIPKKIFNMLILILATVGGLSLLF